jgi:hypothetical protein
METEVRKIVAYRLGPVEPTVIHEHGKAEGREGLGDRTQIELRIGGDGQTRLGVAQAERLETFRLAIGHHGQRNAGDLPFLHGFIDQVLEPVRSQIRHWRYLHPAIVHSALPSRNAQLDDGLLPPPTRDSSHLRATGDDAVHGPKDGRS